jgi:branched-chain amino acid transport system ATP-binding protein
LLFVVTELPGLAEHPTPLGGNVAGALPMDAFSAQRKHGAGADMAGELAFGGQRLLEFARALARSPKLLLLDEPTAGLTPAETDAFADKLRTILDRNVTFLVVEHDLRFITSIAEKVIVRFIISIAEKIIVLARGQKNYDGAAGDIRNDARVVEAYIGSRRERQQHA